jgi:hypothetical protein
VAPISNRRNSINHQPSLSRLWQGSLVAGSGTHSHLARQGNYYSGGLQNRECFPVSSVVEVVAVAKPLRIHTDVPGLAKGVDCAHRETR